MIWSIEFLEEAEKDMKKLDHSAQIQVLKGIKKVSQESVVSEGRWIWETIPGRHFMSGAENTAVLALCRGFCRKKQVL